MRLKILPLHMVSFFRKSALHFLFYKCELHVFKKGNIWTRNFLTYPHCSEIVWVTCQIVAQACTVISDVFRTELCWNIGMTTLLNEQNGRRLLLNMFQKVPQAHSFTTNVVSTLLRCNIRLSIFAISYGPILIRINRRSFCSTSGSSILKNMMESYELEKFSNHIYYLNITRTTLVIAVHLCIIVWHICKGILSPCSYTGKFGVALVQSFFKNRAFIFCSTMKCRNLI